MRGVNRLVAISFSGDADLLVPRVAAGVAGRIAPLFPLAGRARARGSFKIIQVLNRLDGRAAHPDAGRVMVARSQSVRAHLGRLAVAGLEPTVRPGSEEERVGRVEGQCYSYEVSPEGHVAEDVRLEAIDLPTEPPVMAAPLLPPRLREFYGQPRLVPLEEVESARSFFAVQPADYLTLVRRMVDCGMAEVCLASELGKYPRFVMNGMFGIPKGSSGKQRLIVDCRAGNAHMPAPENPGLPDRAIFGELILDPREDWAIGTTDLATYVYSLLVEPWITGLQGLPAVEVPHGEPLGGRCGTVYPALRVAAMGNAHSMVIAQAVHRAMWRLPPRMPSGLVDRTQWQDTAGSRDEIGLRGRSRAVRCAIDRAAISVYVDDAAQIGRKAVVEAAQENFVASIARAKLRFSVPKWERPSKGPVITLGLEVDLTSGRVRPNPKGMHELIGDTLRTIRSERISRRAAASLVGRWTDALLVRRPLLSVFDAVYERRAFRGNQERVRSEFRCAVDLAPAIYRNVFRLFAALVIAYDASATGGAVVYAQVEPEVAERLAQLNARNLQDDASLDISAEEQTRRLIAVGFVGFPWKLAMRRDFRRVDEHINTLEATMLVTSLEWASRSAAHRGRRLIIFGDNQAVVYAATKGRSSSDGLCHLLRQVAAYEVAADFHVYHAWVPTLINPADADSRYYEGK